MKTISIHNEAFEAHTYLFYDCKPLAAAKWIEANLKGIPAHITRWLQDNSENAPAGVCLSDVGKSAHTVIWLSESPRTARGIELLSHEASHSAFRVMQNWSIAIDENSQEILAMLTGFIVKKVLATLAPKSKRS